MRIGFVATRIVFVLTVTSLFGCVATSDDMRGAYIRQARTEEKLNRLSRDVENIHRILNNTRGGGLSTDELKRLEVRLNKLERTLQSLNARISKLELRKRRGPVRPTYPSERYGGQGSTYLRPEPPRNVFTDAYRAFTKGNYPESRELFKEFLRDKPNSPQATDAAFWICESFYRGKKYEEAILEYQTFIDTYPRDQRVPHAYLKQALSLININRREEAKLFLQTLIDRYPKSDDSRFAKEKLRELALESR
ncbi:MAG: tol-pal system protein YbgF [Thermodesulfobacteriota bacterium]